MLKSIRSKIILGFMACVGLAVLGFAVVFMQVLTFQSTDRVARDSFGKIAASSQISDASRYAQTAVARYLFTVSGADSEAMNARIQELTAVAGDAGGVNAMAKAASGLIQKTQLGGVTLSASGGSLSSPIVSMLEVAANANDPAISLQVSQMAQSYALITVGLNRVVAIREMGEVDNIRRQLQRLAKMADDFGKQETTSNRLKKVSAAVGREVEAVTKSLEDYSVLVRERDAAVRTLQEALSKLVNDNSKRLQALSEEFSKATVASKDANDAMMTALVVAAPAVVVIGMILAFFIGRSLSRPIVALAENVKLIATGDYCAEVPGKERSDEIGLMAGSVEILKQGAIERERLEAAQLAEATDRERRVEAVDLMVKDFDATSTRIIQTFLTAANDLDAMARQLAENSNDTSARAVATSASATQTAANVATVAEAAMQLRSSIEEINHKVVQSAETANQAVQIAGSTFETMSELATAGSEIGDVINLISAIAAQTNLLALNATIEAARAGEAGKGFAVVASEVKMLATQTAGATAQIAEKVSRIQSITMEASNAIEQIRNSIGNINSMSGAIAAAMTEQNAATDEIARSIDEAAKGADEVTSTITAVSRGADEVRDASSQTQQATSRLSQEATVLSKSIGDFLKEIRAA